jgi:hypothetical protein
MDTNCAAHLAILAADLSPTIETIKKTAYVPSTGALAPVTITYSGIAILPMNGVGIECQQYELQISSVFVFDLYIRSGELLGAMNRAGGVQFLKVRN